MAGDGKISGKRNPGGERRLTGKRKDAKKAQPVGAGKNTVELARSGKHAGSVKRAGSGKHAGAVERAGSGRHASAEKHAGSGKYLCPVSGVCGGCQYLDMPYEEQLKMKQQQIQKLLGRFCKVHPIIGMDNPFHYRNKVHAVFGYQKGEVVSGVYQEGTHRLVPVERCMIEDEKADEIIRTIRRMLKSFKIRTYDEDTGYGLLRHVLVRRALSPEKSWLYW